MAMTDAPVRKDAVVAIAGGAAALGGLILVFLGVIVSGRTSYAGGTDPSVLRPFKRAAGAILAVFAWSLICSVLAVAWLVTGGGAGALYESALWTFIGLLLAVLVVAVATVYMVVLT